MSKRFKKFKRNFIKIINKPEMSILPGQLAYFLVLAVIPTISIVTFGAAFFNLSTDVIYEFLTDSFSENFALLILSAKDSVSETHFSSTLIVIIGYLVASNGASSIIITSNTIYGIKNTGFLQRYLKSFIMISLLVFLLMIMLFIPMFGDTIMNLVSNFSDSTSVVNNVTLFITILQGPLLWFILFLFIKLIYTMAPDKKINTKYVNYGALFTTISWLIVTNVYSFYVNEVANYTALYGNLANLIILMLWFYLLSYCFTIGLALNYHKEEEETFYNIVLNKNNES